MAQRQVRYFYCLPHLWWCLYEQKSNCVLLKISAFEYICKCTYTHTLALSGGIFFFPDGAPDAEPVTSRRSVDDDNNASLPDIPAEGEQTPSDLGMAARAGDSPADDATPEERTEIGCGEETLSDADTQCQSDERMESNALQADSGETETQGECDTDSLRETGQQHETESADVVEQFGSDTLHKTPEEAAGNLLEPGPKTGDVNVDPAAREPGAGTETQQCRASPAATVSTARRNSRSSSKDSQQSDSSSAASATSRGSSRRGRRAKSRRGDRDNKAKKKQVHGHIKKVSFAYLRNQPPVVPGGGEKRPASVSVSVLSGASSTASPRSADEEEVSESIRKFRFYLDDKCTQRNAEAAKKVQLDLLRSEVVSAVH